MELDTGAAVSVISEQLHKKLFPDAKMLFYVRTRVNLWPSHRSSINLNLARCLC